MNDLAIRLFFRVFSLLQTKKSWGKYFLLIWLPDRLLLQLGT